MKPIEKQIIDKVSAVLNNLGMEWAIKDSDNVVHGTLKLEQPKPAKPKKQNAIYGYGVLRAHLDKHGLSGMPINTHKVIPTGGMDAEVVRRSVCSYGSQNWGNGTYKTSITADRKGVEVTRFDTKTAQFLKSDPLADLFKVL